MIEPAEFITALAQHQISFFAGVPDSLLAGLIADIAFTCPPSNHVVCANEGSAVALASGYYLATGNIACLYMQNSGIGNAINPLVSLADPQVYGIPILLVIGWRGEPGIKDEPQHKKQGAITQDLLKALGIDFDIMDAGSDLLQTVHNAASSMRSRTAPYALLVRAGTFTESGATITNTSREAAIDVIANAFGNDAAIVATTGKIGRELFEARIRNQQLPDSDFLCVGSMGHASQVALGISLAQPERRVVCLDGDGAALMHLGHLATIAAQRPKKFVHCLLNNRVHDSVGAQSTTNPAIDFASLARVLGYSHSFQAADPQALKDTLDTVRELDGPVFIEIMLEPGARADLGRPTCSTTVMKERFMRYLSS